MDWGIALGFLCLILLQVGCAIAAVFLLFALKTQIQRTTDAHNEYTRRAETLEDTHSNYSKKFEKMVAKFESNMDLINDLKARKLDTLEEVEKNLRQEIKRCGARVSYLHGLLKDGPTEEEEESATLPPDAMYVPGEKTQPAPEQVTENQIQADFGKVA